MVLLKSTLFPLLDIDGPQLKKRKILQGTSPIRKTGNLFARTPMPKD